MHETHIVKIGSMRGLDRKQHVNGWPCDRTSIFGNPFHMAQESDRAKVCDDFGPYFHERLNKDPDYQGAFSLLLTSLKAKGTITLLCWCYPKRCHTQTIADHLVSTLWEEGHAAQVAS